MSYHFLDVYLCYNYNVVYMFHWCKSLSYLPDLSKWNKCKLIDADCMFAGSCSIGLFPDLSKWNTSKLIINKYSMDNILFICTFLVYSNYINFINMLKMGNDSLLAYDKYKNCLSSIDVANHFCNKNFYIFFNPNNSKKSVKWNDIIF